ncbi:lipocalin family protein [Salinimicrobium xinjiangense]|uniref:lipocalin family protein n=1 Tax=Salinimicrobium xinjiangense TaxID=438596 RepID=UPI0004919234|nr:lipocalin family protein [Salinimicrobium xinjiangense]
MKRNLLYVIWGIMLTPLLFSCSTDEMSSDSQDLNLSGTATVQEEQILVSDLVGTWNIYSMTSVPLEEGGEATAVDFDQNGSFTYDLLEETDCFDAMYFTFEDTGNVQTTQSRLFFSATTGMFSCQTTKDYTATYSVEEGNILTINFKVNDVDYTETRSISRYTDNGNEFLKVTLTKEETDAAVYVSPDPGNTVASEIQKIEMIYIKQ